jgi:hypothetical protein
MDRMEFGKPTQLTALALVKRQSVEPDNKETRDLQKLIGLPMTSFAVLQGGGVYIEFYPHGAITIRPNFGQEIVPALALLGDECERVPETKQ